MGNNANASLFYGIVLKENAVTKLIKKFKPEIKDAQDDDLSEQLKSVAYLKKFDVVYHINEYSVKKDEYGIAVYERSWSDYEELKSFKVPDEIKLKEKWNKLAEKLGLGSKKPGWYLFANYC
jgi:hypothetical protein